MPIRFSQLSYAEAGKKHSGQNIDCREPLEKHLLIHLRKNTLLYYSNMSGLCLISQTSTSPCYPWFFCQTAVFTLNGCYTDVNCLQFITLDYSFSWKMTHMSCLICVCWSSKQCFVLLSLASTVAFSLLRSPNMSVINHILGVSTLANKPLLAWKN